MNHNSSLTVARLALTEHGTAFIFDNFEVFFSIIEIAKDLPKQAILRTVDLLYKALDQLGKELAEVLTESTNLTDANRSHFLNALKMLLYAQITLIKKIDKVIFVYGDAKGKNRKAPEDLDLVQYEDKRYKTLLQLFNIISLPLQNLWQPPVAEETFVNLCADLAYRSLEHATNKDKNVGDTSFQILGTLLKRFNHSIVFPIRTFEILKSCDSAISSIAQGMVILYEQYGIQTIFKVMIEQVLQGLDDSADAQAVKNISNFLTELGSIAPTLLMPFIREVADEVLSLDSYQLRICILTLMCEIVISELSGENLTQDQRNFRDEYLQYIADHILDINAHVRAKSIGLWNRLKEENAVPVMWISYVMKCVVARLDDKSALVRKNAIQMIISFLERNPFASKLPIEELEKRYNDKMKELSDLRTKMIEESNKVDEVNEKWEEFLIEMKPYIIKCSRTESIEDEGIYPEDCAKLYEEFAQMLEEKKFKRLVLLVRKAEELNGNWEVVKNFQEEEALLYFAMLLKSYYLLQNSCKNYEEDYKKTENAVRFLEDSLEFSRLLVNAVPKLQNLMMSKTESDSVEAINFFTAAYLFGIKNTEEGMRQMLYLVWMTAKDKREPVKAAFKHVLWNTDLTGR
jgi:condensin complex subunit 1